MSCSRVQTELACLTVHTSTFIILLCFVYKSTDAEAREVVSLQVVHWAAVKPLHNNYTLKCEVFEHF